MLYDFGSSVVTRGSGSANFGWEGFTVVLVTMAYNVCISVRKYISQVECIDFKNPLVQSLSNPGAVMSIASIAGSGGCPMTAAAGGVWPASPADLSEVTPSERRRRALRPCCDTADAQQRSI